MNKKKLDFDYKYSIFLIIFLAIFTSLIPYACDDWAWGSSIGIERLERFFAGYNGRYLGNLIVIAITRSQILRVVLMTVVMYLIILLCYKIINKKNSILFLTSTIFILGMPRDMFVSSYVWSSGFSNYAMSAFFVLIYIFLIRKLLDGKEFKYSKLMIIPVFLLAYLGSLIMEHVTLYTICLGIFVIIYSYIKFRKVNYVNVAYLIGSILGATTMFMNSSYRNIAGNKDFYREIPKTDVGSLINNAIKSFLNEIYQGGALNNIIINFIIAICATVIIYKFIKSKRTYIGKRGLLLCNLINFVLISYPIYGLINIIVPNWNILLRYTKYFEALYSIIFYISILIFIIIFIDNKILKTKLLFYFGSILILIAPLFVVNPLNQRCFAAPYIFFVLISNELINYLLKDIKDNEFLSIIKKILITIIVCIFVFFLSIYASLAHTNNTRIKHISSELSKGVSIIEIPKYHYGKYLWSGTPGNNTMWEDRYKMFYGIPKEVDIVTLSPKKWHEKYEKNN